MGVNSGFKGLIPLSPLNFVLQSVLLFFSGLFPGGLRNKILSFFFQRKLLEQKAA